MTESSGSALAPVASRNLSPVRKSPIAANPEYGGTAIRRFPDRADNRFEIIRIHIVITGPVFEKVSQNVELFGLFDLIFQKVQKCTGRFRQCRLQVQIRNEKCLDRHFLFGWLIHKDCRVK